MCECLYVCMCVPSLCAVAWAAQCRLDNSARGGVHSRFSLCFVPVCPRGVVVGLLLTAYVGICCSRRGHLAASCCWRLGSCLLYLPRCGSRFCGKRSAMPAGCGADWSHIHAFPTHMIDFIGARCRPTRVTPSVAAVRGPFLPAVVGAGHRDRLGAVHRPIGVAHTGVVWHGGHYSRLCSCVWSMRCGCTVNRAPWGFLFCLWCQGYAKNFSYIALFDNLKAGSECFNGHAGDAVLTSHDCRVRGAGWRHRGHCDHSCRAATSTVLLHVPWSRVPACRLFALCVCVSRWESLF